MGFTIKKSDIQTGGGLPSEDWHRFETGKCDEGYSENNGDKYYCLRLCKPGTDQVLVWQDYAMLEGRGSGIGWKKLDTLGCVEDLGDEMHVCDASQVVGTRGWCRIKHEKYDKVLKGKPTAMSKPENVVTNAKVDINYGKAGYQPWDWKPDEERGGGAQDIETPEEDDDIPF